MPRRLTPEDYYRLRTDLLKLQSALYDRNTELSSYHAVFGQLRAHFEKARRMGILVVSVGELSQVESIYGWQVFDDVLRRIAATLTGLRGSLFPDAAIVAPDGVGAERFVVFLPSDPRGAEITPGWMEGLVPAVRERLEATFRGEAFRSMTPRPRFRVGQATLVEDPFHRFERLVYRAVERASGARTADRQRSRLEEELRRILREGEVHVVFQPIHSLEGGGILGYEALSRGPEGGVFRDPRAMFDLGERLGLAGELDALCQRRAILGASRLEPGRKLFVNALPATLLADDSGGWNPAEWIRRAGLEPSDVVIEITERGRVEDRERLAHRVAGLRRMGLGVALDDIGTGLTGLQAIAEMRPDFLKLDVSLVHNIQSNLVSQDLLRSLTQVARNIGARVVGEGVETEQEVATLRECGTDFAQGYLFSRPGPELAP
ncbi:MAG: GGDEF domain-containing phosphodiesterase [Acidobacteriota bacterium]|jgi:EAL domain-containing protein (putative c-di-GMP-specific phosphodiesterase class I)/GGDEF domain-containing protein